MPKSDPNLPLIEDAARLLHPLLDELVFIGGCATGLLITDPAAAGVRPTMDVDVITHVASYAEYASLCDRLRDLGLQEEREGGVICRWRSGELLLDVMPTDERVLGFANRWYAPALSAARVVELSTGRIRLIRSEYFLATKLDAFHGRGEDDIVGSHDLEDAIAVIDGRAEVTTEVRTAAADVRHYLAREFASLLAARAFLDALPGFLLPDPASQARQPLLLKRLREIADGRTDSGPAVE
jgi:hypothetical protein